MSTLLKNGQNHHWWIPIEHVGDTGECRRFPLSVMRHEKVRIVALEDNNG
jgi:hypothetical protein